MLKKVFAIIIIFSVLFVGCEDNSNFIKKNNSIKVSDIYGQRELYYGSNYNVFIKIDDRYQILIPYLASYPEVSSDKKSFAYIGPVENSDSRGLYVYNIKKDNEILIYNDNNKVKISPKIVKWIDNQFLLFIADYGSINVDSKLYMLDTIQESLYVIETSYKSKEFKNIQVENQMITIEIGNKDDFLKDTNETVDYSYTELLSKARVISYQIIGELAGNIEVYYGGRKTIFIETEQRIEVLNEYVSFPSLSPDNSKIAYIDGEQDSPRRLYIYNSTNDNIEIILETDKKGLNTPKVAKWLNDHLLLLIVGYGYGTVSLGGSLYLYDVDHEQLNLLMSPEKDTEFWDIKIRGESIIIDVARWSNDSYNVYLLEEKEVLYSEVIDKMSAE